MLEASNQHLQDVESFIEPSVAKYANDLALVNEDDQRLLREMVREGMEQDLESLQRVLRMNRMFPVLRRIMAQASLKNSRRKFQME